MIDACQESYPSLPLKPYGSPLVVSLQRTGFSLLIDLVSEILGLTSPSVQGSPSQIMLNRHLPFLSRQLNSQYQSFFDRAGLGERLLFNGEFQLLVGGPKWINTDYPDDIFVRKYFGVKDKGDFLLAARYPKTLFSYYGIQHSSNAPQTWTQADDYQHCNFLTSIRNPIGVFNSAVHSINALTSEYIQRFRSDDDESALRYEIGLSKLTDSAVCDGLIKYQMAYWKNFFPVAERFKSYRWEELILNPIETIQQIATMVERELTIEQAQAIWKPRDHRNLLVHHKHNYRKDKGVVGEWRGNIINEHLDIFKHYDAGLVFKELGYEFPEPIDEKNYTDYQRTIKKYWDSGQPYKIADKNLSGFAFNKSNIDTSQFTFDSLPAINRVEIERSDFNDKNLLKEFQHYTEEATNDLLVVVDLILSSDGSDRAAKEILKGQYPSADVRPYLASFIDSRHQNLAKLESYLSANAGKSFVLWGLGTDFDYWLANFEQAEALIALPEIVLADSARSGQWHNGKMIYNFDQLKVPRGTIVIPVTINYDTRMSMASLAADVNRQFLDVYGVDDV